MPVTIAKLSTVATLDSTKFSTGLAKMRVDVGAFTSIAIGAFARIGTAITGMVVRGITALPRLVASGLSLGDALSDSSKMTGIAASRLSVYYRAARLAGVGTAEFDQMIGRLNVNVAEAIQGDKKFAAILQRSGIDLAKIATLSPDETFLALADAISKTGNAFDRAFIAQAAFGRGGFRLLPLLSGGLGGISNLAASTRALGAAPSSLEVLKLERANDALQDLGTALIGLKTTIALQVAEPLERAAKGLIRFLEESKIIPNIGTASGGGTLAIVGTIANALGLEGRLAAPGGGVKISSEEQRMIDLEIRERSYRRRGFGPKKIAMIEGYTMGPPSELATPPFKSSRSGRYNDTETMDIHVILDETLEENKKQTEALNAIKNKSGGMKP